MRTEGHLLEDEFNSCITDRGGKKIDQGAIERLDVGRIWSGAVKVLGEVGLEIANDDVAASVGRKQSVTCAVRYLIDSLLPAHYEHTI